MRRNGTHHACSISCEPFSALLLVFSLSFFVPSNLSSLFSSFFHFSHMMSTFLLFAFSFFVSCFILSCFFCFPSPNSFFRLHSLLFCFLVHVSSSFFYYCCSLDFISFPFTRLPSCHIFVHLKNQKTKRKSTSSSFFLFPSHHRNNKHSQTNNRSLSQMTGTISSTHHHTSNNRSSSSSLFHLLFFSLLFHSVVCFVLCYVPSPFMVGFISFHLPLSRRSPPRFIIYMMPHQPCGTHMIVASTGRDRGRARLTHTAAHNTQREQNCTIFSLSIEVDRDNTRLFSFFLDLFLVFVASFSFLRFIIFHFCSFFFSLSFLFYLSSCVFLFFFFFSFSVFFFFPFHLFCFVSCFFLFSCRRQVRLVPSSLRRTHPFPSRSALTTHIKTSNRHHTPHVRTQKNTNKKKKQKQSIAIMVCCVVHRVQTI